MWRVPREPNLNIEKKNIGNLYVNKQSSPEFILFDGEVIFGIIANNLLASNFFSVLMDGSTIQKKLLYAFNISKKISL